MTAARETKTKPYCAWYDDGDGVRYHVPQCWGTVHDPDGPCYCRTRPREREEGEELPDIYDLLESIDRRLQKLEKDKA